MIYLVKSEGIDRYRQSMNKTNSRSFYKMWLELYRWQAGRCAEQYWKSNGAAKTYRSRICNTLKALVNNGKGTNHIENAKAGTNDIVPHKTVLLDKKVKRIEQQHIEMGCELARIQQLSTRSKSSKYSRTQCSTQVSRQISAGQR